MEEWSLKAHLKVQPLTESMSLLDAIGRKGQDVIMIVLLNDVGDNRTRLPEKHSRVGILDGFRWSAIGTKTSQLHHIAALTRH
jgi:hypothetical protein